VTLEDVATVREDGVAISFGTASELTLGDIHEGDTRRAVWTSARPRSAPRRSPSARGPRTAASAPRA
jgi:hypothetical protein